MILATGFRYSFSFLPQYYDGADYICASRRLCHDCIALPSLGQLAHPRLVSRSVLSPGPHTCIPWRFVAVLCFVFHLCSFKHAVPLGARSFPSLQYTTLALAKVWTNTAKLPNSQTMRALHEKTVEERGGYGKYVLYWGPVRSSGEPFVPRFVLGLSIQSCHTSSYCLSNWLAEHGGGQVWWQAGSLRPLSFRFRY